MVPWAIMATANDLPRGSRMKVEGTGGVWLLLLSLVLHVSALTSGFHLIAKQRMHLRHPGWVSASCLDLVKRIAESRIRSLLCMSNGSMPSSSILSKLRCSRPAITTALTVSTMWLRG